MDVMLHTLFRKITIKRAVLTMGNIPRARDKGQHLSIIVGLVDTDVMPYRMTSSYFFSAYLCFRCWTCWLMWFDPCLKFTSLIGKSLECFVESGLHDELFRFAFASENLFQQRLPSLLQRLQSCFMFTGIFVTLVQLFGDRLTRLD